MNNLDFVSNQLRIEYVPLSQCQLWADNPKEHDTGAVIQSIQRHGFRDPSGYDPNLNGGAGGIADGNGRIIALRMMESSGYEPPKHIAIHTETGAWCIPIVFGGDAGSEAAAEAWGIDANNLTMAGGDFDHSDMARMWQPGRYTDLLQRIARQGSEPVTVDGDTLDALLSIRKARAASQADSGDQSQAKPLEDGQIWRLDTGHTLIIEDAATVMMPPELADILIKKFHGKRENDE